MKQHIEHDEKGNITIEAAIVMSVCALLVLFFVSIMQIIAAQNVLEMSLIKTGNKMCKWAPIYKYIVADNIEKELSEEIIQKVSNDIDDEAKEIIAHVLNLNNVSQISTDYLYGFIAQQLCQKYIDETPLVKENVLQMNNLNLYKSSFFINDTNEIELVGVCEVETFFSLTSKLSFKLKCGAWGKGVNPHISIESELGNEADSIWDKDNYTRGKIIRNLFGANMPDNFPVLAIYENGVATMIKSMNHTAPSYTNEVCFKNNITEMIDELYNFNGKEWGDIIIEKEDIRIKRLLLVMPENNFSNRQQQIINEIMKYASLKGIVIDLRRYQKV